MEIWTKIIDNYTPWDFTYLDFAKAFDEVPHCRFIKKLTEAGIGGKIFGWLTDFLDNRVQLEVIKLKVNYT